MFGDPRAWRGRSKQNRWFYLRSDLRKPVGAGNRVGPFYLGRRDRVFRLDSNGKLVPLVSKKAAAAA